MPRPLIVLPLALVMLAAPARTQAQNAPDRGPVGEALHKCMFNRPCNWTGHATLGAGIVLGLHQLNVKAEYAAILSSLVWVGKELRDERKWGDVLGTPDSNGDLLSGVLGAWVTWGLVRLHERGTPRLTITRDTDRRTTVEVKLPSF
jgi:hypothetical protein